MDGVLGHLFAYIGLWAKLEPLRSIWLERVRQESQYVQLIFHAPEWYNSNEACCLIDLSSTWIGMFLNKMGMTSYLTSFSGFPNAALCTNAAKSLHGAIEIAVTYPYSVSVCRIRVHVNTFIDNSMKRFLPDAVDRMPYAFEHCFKLSRGNGFESRLNRMLIILIVHIKWPDCSEIWKRLPMVLCSIKNSFCPLVARNPEIMDSNTGQDSCLSSRVCICTTPNGSNCSDFHVAIQ